MATNLGDISSFVEIGAAKNSALNEWKHACALLSNAINFYASACTTLRTTCAVPAYHSSGYPGIEETLLIVDSHLGLLELEEEKLRSTRALLTALRNRSTTLAPVNKLPQEILSYVFILAKSYCVHDEDFGSHDPAAVCSDWRRIAINTPNLWAHIDIGPGTPERLTKLLLNRTKDYPIYIHAHELDANPSDNESSPEDEAKMAVDLLEPHIHRARGFVLKSQRDSRSFTSAMLKMWLSYGSSTSSKYLLVSRPTASMMRVHIKKSRSKRPTDRSKSENAEDVLSSLKVLHLQGVTISYDSKAYRGLTDLRLDFSNNLRDSIPVFHFANILSSSPDLSILKLGGIDITDTEGWSSPGPIHLGSLKVLKLFGMRSDSLRLVLSLIGLPDSPVELSLSFMEYSDMYDELVAFFRGACITTLHLCHEETYNSPEYRLSDLPPPWLPISGLHTLILENHHLPSSIAEYISPTSSQSTSLPRLAVILLQCRVHFESLIVLVSDLGVQELYLEQCVAAEESNIGLEAMRYALLLYYLGLLRCSVSDTIDSTSRLPCRTVLDD
ncbi:hypothetical protein FRC12_015359 [Ceratobasidium sp. 428]|nr:hypothetical protein FRC12_015359 [Ceratobasidium sp. 428]